MNGQPNDNAPWSLADIAEIAGLALGGLRLYPRGFMGSYGNRGYPGIAIGAPLAALGAVLGQKQERQQGQRSVQAMAKTLGLSDVDTSGMQPEDLRALIGPLMKQRELQQEMQAFPEITKVLADVERPQITGTTPMPTGQGALLRPAPAAPVSDFMTGAAPPSTQEMLARVQQVPAPLRPYVSRELMPELVRRRGEESRTAAEQQAWGRQLERIGGPAAIRTATPEDLEAIEVQLGPASKLGASIGRFAASRRSGDLKQQQLDLQKVIQDWREASGAERQAMNDRITDLRERMVSLQERLRPAELDLRRQGEARRASESTARMEHIKALTDRAKQGGPGGAQALRELTALRGDLVARRAGLLREYEALSDPIKGPGMMPWAENRRGRADDLRNELNGIDTQLRAIATQRQAGPAATPAPVAGRAPSRADVNNALRDARGDKGKAAAILRRRGFDLNVQVRD